jgi:hypothetical protein
MQASGVAFAATRKHINGPLIPDNSHGLYVSAQRSAAQRSAAQRSAVAAAARRGAVQ